MSSREVLSEATRWLIELEGADRLEDVWPEFDDWFQASAAHRAAYAKVRRAWARCENSKGAVLRGVPLHRPRWLRAYRWSYAQAWVSYWLPWLTAIAVTILVYSTYGAERLECVSAVAPCVSVFSIPVCG